MLTSRNTIIGVQSKLGGNLGRVRVMTIWPADFVPSHLVLGGMKAKAQNIYHCCLWVLGSGCGGDLDSLLCLFSHKHGLRVYTFTKTS